MSLKVLIIDDDASMTELMSVMLRGQGMEVQTCYSAAQGIERAKNDKFDMILLDLMMPGIDGWEACKTLRTLTSTPIAILSAIDDPVLISAALDAGADDYMTKPIPSRVLIAHIKNLARRHQVETDTSTMLRQMGLSDTPNNGLNPQ